MGIKGLLPFLKSKNLCKPFVDFVPGTSVAIDVPIFAHKFIYAERTYKALEKRFVLFAEDLRNKQVEPLFVFDGSKLPLKDNERSKRAKARDATLDRASRAESKYLESLLEANIEIVEPVVQSSPDVFMGLMFPTAKEYTDLKNHLGSLGYQTFSAKYEAEALCAHMTANGLASCALTEDSDALAFGSPTVVFKYGTSEACIVGLEDCLQTLDMTRAQFIDLCCMFGCDFCPNVYKIGPVGAFKLLQDHKTWPGVLEAKKDLWPKLTHESALEFDRAYKEVFDCFWTKGYEAQVTNEETIVMTE